MNKKQLQQVIDLIPDNIKLNSREDGCGYEIGVYEKYIQITIGHEKQWMTFEFSTYNRCHVTYFQDFGKKVIEYNCNTKAGLPKEVLKILKENFCE